MSASSSPPGSRNSRAALTIAAGLVTLLGCVTASRAVPGGSAPALRLLATYAVPGAPSAATDVRWAGEKSVYLARAFGGVAEVELSEKLDVRHKVVPSKQSFRFHSVERIAASKEVLVISSQAHDFAWRQLATVGTSGVSEFFRWAAGSVWAMDVWGDRVVILGYPQPKVQNEFQDIVWSGSLRAGLSDLHPILKEPSSATITAFDNCDGVESGAVRFLADGSLVVLPGARPDVLLFRPDGTLKRTWDAAALGLATANDCARIEEKEARLLHRDPERRLAWLNQRSAVDAILPLPQGPGVLVRTWEQGAVHWRLKVLTPSGAVETYNVPLTSPNPWDRLRGDVRDGKIALLVSAHTSYLSGGAASAGTLVIAELP